MKNILICSLFLLMFFTGFGQWDRFRKSTPPYGLDKVKGLIKKIKIPESDDDSYSAPMPAKTFASLSLREQFTYNMIYAEDYSQNCDGWFGDSLQARHIYGNLINGFGDGNWGSGQLKWLHDHRDSVMALIKESSLRSGHLGLNYKNTLVEVNAVEMIPFLIEFYNKDKKDRDILTVLLLLLEKSKFPAFINSASHRKLYGDGSSYYEACIDYNAANEALIFQRATDLYKSLHP